MEGPTDVLSFAQREGDEVGGGIGENLLGDVVISLDTAQRQADEQELSVEKEVDMLLVHGLLHLLGYDHAEPAEGQEMFARQETILNSEILNFELGAAGREAVSDSAPGVSAQPCRHPELDSGSGTREGDAESSSA